MSDLFVYTLRLGDDALIAAQRTAEWIAAAPQLEEDVALGNIGLDQLGYHLPRQTTHVNTTHERNESEPAWSFGQ